jgi:GR25 family glycosyltransferase involved in LPS biosynthesis
MDNNQLTESSIHFFVINLPKCEERYQDISRILDSFKLSYSRIEAIDGYDLENNEDCKKILKQREQLIGQKFRCIATNEEWIYDGTIKTSFPGYVLNGNYGIKGLTVSNIKTFLESQNMNYEWFCILEDDAEINEENISIIHNFIKNSDNNDYDVVLLDDREWGGASALLYNKRIIPKLIEDLHPLSDFSIINEATYGDPNLWDWKLNKYICNHNKNIKFKCIPCISSGKYPSTITDSLIVLNKII